MRASTSVSTLFSTRPASNLEKLSRKGILSHQIYLAGRNLTVPPSKLVFRRRTESVLPLTGCRGADDRWTGGGIPLIPSVRVASASVRRSRERETKAHHVAQMTHFLTVVGRRSSRDFRHEPREVPGLGKRNSYQTQNREAAKKALSMGVQNNLRKCHSKMSLQREYTRNSNAKVWF